MSPPTKTTTLSTKYYNSVIKFSTKQIKYLVQKYPAPPTLNVLLKLHKPSKPIRPFANNRNVPSYKVIKKLNAILNQNLHVDNQYIATNSNTLTNALIKLKIKPNHRLLTLNIKDLYVNIPISETIKITKNQLLKNNDIQITNRIITLLEIILN